jgi:hypothetical protein
VYVPFCGFAQFGTFRTVNLAVAARKTIPVSFAGLSGISGKTVAAGRTVKRGPLGSLLRLTSFCSHPRRRLSEF